MLKHILRRCIKINQTVEQFKILENDNAIKRMMNKFNKTYGVKLNLSEVISQVFIQLPNFNETNIQTTFQDVINNKELIIEEIKDFITPPLRTTNGELFPYGGGYGFDKHEINNIDYVLNDKNAFEFFKNLPISFYNFTGHNYNKNKYFLTMNLNYSSYYLKSLKITLAKLTPFKLLVNHICQKFSTAFIIMIL